MTIDALLTSAKRADSMGQLQQSLSLCKQAVHLDPSCVPAYVLGGSVSARLGNREEAVGFLRRAVQLDPHCLEALRWLTTLLIGVEGGTEAVRFGHAAVILAPDRADLHAGLGLAALGTGQNDLAISSFIRATELAPGMAGAFHNLGVAYQREEAFEDAAAAYRRALELSPRTWETHLHLGRTYLAMDRGEGAVECALKVLSLNPRSGSAMKLRADASYAASQGPNGEAFLAGIIDQNPNAAFPKALLASRLQESGKFSEAEEVLLESIHLEPVQGLAYYLLANNRRVAPEDRQRFERLTEIIAANAMDPVERSFANFALGKAFDDLKEYERAIRHLDLANGEGSRQSTHPSEEDVMERRARRFGEILSREKIGQAQMSEPYDVNPIFIVGMPRSGTTLLEQILSRHPSIGAAGEQSFWRDAGRQVIDLSSGDIHLSALSSAAHRYIVRLKSLTSGEPRVTDKFPSNYMYLGLLKIAFPKAKFIHASRHPIDTCISIYMRPFFALHESGRPRQQIVDAYRTYERSMQHWKFVLGQGAIFDVPYERLVTDQESVVRSILSFCELPWDEACLSPEKGDRRVITYSKWQVRQPVYTTSVERWRNYEPWLGAFSQLLES